MEIRHPFANGGNATVKNTDIPTELADFVAGLDELPRTTYSVVTDFGIDWPAGEWTDPVAEGTVAAVKELIAKFGDSEGEVRFTRRRIAVAMGFQRPKQYDRAWRKATGKVVAAKAAAAAPAEAKAATEAPAQGEAVEAAVKTAAKAPAKKAPAAKTPAKKAS